MVYLIKTLFLFTSNKKGHLNINIQNTSLNAFMIYDVKRTLLQSS